MRGEGRGGEGREGEGRKGGGRDGGGKGWGGRGHGRPPKLKLAPRTIFLAPALDLLHCRHQRLNSENTASARDTNTHA